MKHLSVEILSESALLLLKSGRAKTWDHALKIADERLRCKPHESWRWSSKREQHERYPKRTELRS